MTTSGVHNIVFGITIPTPAAGQIAIGSKYGTDLSTMTAGGVAATLLNGTAVDTIDHLNIGSATGAGAGGLAYSGQLTPVRNSVAYTGYVYVPLATALTCATFNAATISAADYTVGGSGDGTYNYAYPVTAKALYIRISCRWAGAGGTNYAAAFCVGSTVNDSAVIARSQVASLVVDGTGIFTLNASGRFILSVATTTASGSSVVVLGYFI